MRSAGGGAWFGSGWRISGRGGLGAPPEDSVSARELLLRGLRLRGLRLRGLRGLDTRARGGEARGDAVLERGEAPFSVFGVEVVDAVGARGGFRDAIASPAIPHPRVSLLHGHSSLSAVT